MLRYNIRYRMRQIKRDDRAISYEGVDALSVPELQLACASRGIRKYLVPYICVLTNDWELSQAPMVFHQLV